MDTARRFVLALLAVLVLVGCGTAAAGGAASGGAAASSSVNLSPEEVHAKWVEALRNNDRETMLDLSATRDLKTMWVDDVRRNMTAQFDPKFPPKFLGVFQNRTSTDPTKDVGKTKEGISHWYFANKEVCYTTELTLEDSGWKVSDWHQEVECPKSVAHR